VITAKQRGEFHAKYEKAKFKPYEVRFNKCAPRPAPAPLPARRRRTRGAAEGTCVLHGSRRDSLGGAQALDTGDAAQAQQV